MYTLKEKTEPCHSHCYCLYCPINEHTKLGGPITGIDEGGTEVQVGVVSFGRGEFIRFNLFLNVHF